MSILVFGWVFCILSHSDPVLFTNAFVIVVVGVLGSYLIHAVSYTHLTLPTILLV